MEARRITEIAVVAAILISSAFAQGRGTGFSSHPFVGPQAVTPGFATFGISQPRNFPHQHPFGNGSVFYYPGLGYEGYEPVGTQPPSVVIVEQPPAPVAKPEEPAAPIHPLLLELQGDHWVRVDNFQNKVLTAASHQERSSTAGAKPSLPTVLVFRDQRVETITGYAIIGNVLYAQTDYWTTGAWNRKIALADLNIPATLQANQERGVVFQLPAGPNEITLLP